MYRQKTRYTHAPDEWEEDSLGLAGMNGFPQTPVWTYTPRVLSSIHILYYNITIQYSTSYVHRAVS